MHDHVAHHDDGTVCPNLPLCDGQARAESTRTALRRYKEARAVGDFTPLEEYTGFHAPVNDLAMALYHGYFPFPWATYKASQKSRMLADRVVQHPWVLSGAKQAKPGEVYQYDPTWPFWAAVLDMKVASCMGVGVFSREYTQGGTVSADTDEPKVQEFKLLYEEHHILAEWCADKLVMWLRDKQNEKWIDPMLFSFGEAGSEDCAPALEFGQDEGDAGDGAGSSSKENEGSSSRTLRKRRRDGKASRTQDSAAAGNTRGQKRQPLKQIQDVLDSCSDGEPEPDNEYERERFQRIKQNASFLRDLGIEPLELFTSSRGLKGLRN